MVRVDGPHVVLRVRERLCGARPRSGRCPAGALTVGSRSRHVLLVKLPEERAEPLVTTLKSDFKEEFISARSYRATDDEVGELSVDAIDDSDDREE